MQSLLPRATAARIAISTSRSFRATRAVRVAAMSSEPIFDIAVKGDPNTGVLGDCPFCHRALLTLEEKHIPYKKTYIDFSNKPQWLLDVNPAGSVPVMKDLATGEWTVDSGVIADMLEQRFPEVSLGTVEGSPQVGGAIFGAFRDFAKAEGPEDSAAKEAALVQALEELDTYLQKHGPYIGGDKPCATDVSLMPKLYHMETALEHFRGWKMPGHLKAVAAYMDAFKARDSWKNTHYSTDIVIKGWEKHGLTVKK